MSKSDRIETQREREGKWVQLVFRWLEVENEMRLKGLRIQRKSDTEYIVTPLYFSKGKGTRSAPHLREVAQTLRTAMAAVLQRLVDRQDLQP